MAALWNPALFGCIERDSFQLHPANRTTLSSIATGPIRSKKSDASAPITAQIQTNQTFAQWAAFTQWHKFDLACGALPFECDLYLWDHVRRVRARFIGAWRAQRTVYNQFVLSATVEIERESIT